MTRQTPQWLQNGSYAAAQDRQLIAAVWPAATVTGMAVAAPGAGMTVTVAPGQAAVPTPNNTGATLCTSDATETVTLAAAPASGYSRIDVITVHPRGNDLDGGGNDDFVFDVITGAVAQSPTNPTAPAVPAGQVGLANVTVPGGAAAIVAGNVADARPPVGLAVPRMFAQAVPTGAGTVGTAELTIATLAIPALSFAYLLDAAFTLSGYFTTTDTGSSRIRVNGAQVAALRGRGATANYRVSMAIPASVPIRIAAGAAATVTGTMQLDTAATGAFAVEANTQGALRAICWPSN